MQMRVNTKQIYFLSYFISASIFKKNPDLLPIIAIIENYLQFPH